MTKTDVIRHNIALAIYEGWEFIKNDSNVKLYPFGGYLKNNNLKNNVVLPEMLDYHKSYNSLMRIVNKLESTNDTLTISKYSCRIVHPTKGIRYFKGVGDSKFPDKKIESLYLMIIFFLSH